MLEIEWWKLATIYLTLFVASFAAAYQWMRARAAWRLVAKYEWLADEYEKTLTKCAKSLLRQQRDHFPKTPEAES